MYIPGLPYYFDPTYIFVILGVIVTLIAQTKMKTTYARYAAMPSSCGMTGAQVAQRILQQNGIYDVSIGQVQGELTDHYNPQKKVVNLSQAVYGATSIAAISVAAHECGHALQDSKDYLPLRIRTIFAPVANICAKASWPLIIIGIVFGGILASDRIDIGGLMIEIGIVAYLIAVLFQVLTLPVEYNASSRAQAQMLSLGIISDAEKTSVKNVLGAAALTYVANTAASAMQFLRILLMTGGRRNSRR